MTTRKISEIPTQADALTATDRFEVSQGIGTSPVTRYATPGQIADWVETDLTTLPSGLVTNAMVNASAGIVDTKLATISTAGKVSNSATTATNNNTASAIVSRDANGDFAARDASLRQVVLRGDTSGTATIKVPAVAGTPTFTLPAGTGSAGEFLQTNGSGVLAWAAAGGTISPAAFQLTRSLQELSGTTWYLVSASETYDPDNVASVSSGAVTLSAGRWVILAQFYISTTFGTSTNIQDFDARIWNATGSAELASQTNVRVEYMTNYKQGWVGMATAFTASASMTIEVQVRASYTPPTTTDIRVGGGGFDQTPSHGLVCVRVGDA